MSFTEPLSVTIGGTATPLNRIDGPANRRGVFENSANDLSLTFSHANGKTERSVARLDSKKIAADQLNPALLRQLKAGAWLVVERPPVGYTDAEMTDLVKGLTTLINSTGFLAKFLGQES